MTDSTESTARTVSGNNGPDLKEIEYKGRQLGSRLGAFVGLVAAAWSIYQLWIASPFPFMLNFAIISDVPARSVHLGFALFLCFLIYPASRRHPSPRLPVYDVVLALVACFCALYLFFAWDEMARRPGLLLEIDVLGMTVPFEAILGGVGIVLLLEATRRGIGLPLVIVASLFLVYSVFGQSMPDLIAHKGVSLKRLAGYHWLTGEAIFGIPISVTTSFVFLFVLFGAILDRAGAGQYFLNLAFALVGRFRGGPAKAAILASGMTGLISGSSIANVVTTGTFTIPVMKRTGMPAVKAGAIEVAASSDGQIMPPIMGAAAFIIAEFIGITYFDVIVAAAVPAFISYLALFYISHLEAMKLGLTGLPRAEIPRLLPTFLSGAHFLIPIAVLVFMLMALRWSPSSSVFYSIALMMGIIVLQKIARAMKSGDQSVGNATKDGFKDIYSGLVAGGRNMISIAVAVAAAGIIVGSVSSTGLSNSLIGVVETASGGNIYILLALTALLCILLGMGLPTTANYLVVASLMAGVLVELGSAAGLVLPLIAVHLYVFYFGLMADVTPPVALAAFAASAISRADPIRTGVQAFTYHIRTAILPVVFIFNTELLLIGVESVWHGLTVFIVSLLAVAAFSSVTQHWMLVRNKFWESALLLLAAGMLLRPGYFLDFVYPEFAPVEVARFISGEMKVEPGRNVRFHVVRETNYGPRYKLYVIPTPDMASLPPDELFGLEMEPADEGRYEVVDLAFNGLAEQTGLEFGDYVTEVDVAQIGRPPKGMVYPFGLAILGLVVFSQVVRRRRIEAAAA